MAAKWDVDQKLYIPCKVVSVTTDDAGTTYQVKVVAQDKAINLYFEENELQEITGTPEP